MKIRCDRVNRADGKRFLWGFIVCPVFLGLFVCGGESVFRTIEIIGEAGATKSYAQSWFYHRAVDELMTEELAVSKDSRLQWGAVHDGLVLGLMFEGDEFLSNEDVFLRLVIRNKLAVEQKLPLRSVLTNNFSFSLARGLAGQTWTPNTNFTRETLTAGQAAFAEIRPIPTAAQVVAVIRLNEIFDLKATGEYVIEASLLTPSNSVSRCVSGRARFRIVEGLTSAELEKRSSRVESAKLLEGRARKRIEEVHRIEERQKLPVQKP